MPQMLSNLDFGATGVGMPAGNDQDELRVDDPPPADHPSERYSAWKASAIFELLPFSSPPSR